MRKTLYAAALIILGAMAHSALQPMPIEAQAPKPATPAVQAKPVPADDATAIAPLLKQVNDLQSQMQALMQALMQEYRTKLQPLQTQLNGADGRSGVAHDLRIAEQKAFVDAGVDMQQFVISRDGKTFEPRPQGMPQQNR